jgi:hypothetical protein
MSKPVGFRQPLQTLGEDFAPQSGWRQRLNSEHTLAATGQQDADRVAGFGGHFHVSLRGSIPARSQRHRLAKFFPGYYFQKNNFPRSEAKKNRGRAAHVLHHAAPVRELAKTDRLRHPRGCPSLRQVKFILSGIVGRIADNNHRARTRFAGPVNISIGFS